MKWLSENQWSLCYSCIKEAEAENTASVTRASVFLVNKTTRLSFLHTETQNMQSSYLNGILSLNIHRH